MSRSFCHASVNVWVSLSVCQRPHDGTIFHYDSVIPVNQFSLWHGRMDDRQTDTLSSNHVYM